MITCAPPTKQITFLQEKKAKASETSNNKTQLQLCLLDFCVLMALMKTKESILFSNVFNMV